MTWGPSSSLDAAGPQAARLAQVTWGFLAVCAAVYVTVLALVIVAILRRRKSDGSPDPGTAFDERRRMTAVAVGGALTTLTLVALMVVSVRGGEGLNPMRGAHDAVRVRVIARQWWWELQYPGNAADQRVVTANELHIPVGRPVLLELISRDVIHSFWVPSLHGKRDLIPGHDSTTYIEADHPGVFRGQCAEFCGAQHAKMGLLVIAEPPDAWQAWLDRQRQPAAPAESLTEAAARHGRELFLRGTCPMCHTVSGTTAGAGMGPDLTHVGGRFTLGAGTLANVEQHLTDWVADAQAVKPGSRMPPTPLPPGDVHDLVAYLESLQ
jgi:cytochrome c oxidase subunit 2